MREEKLEIPVEALREALINALCHRQYEKHNLTIGIAIYDDRIEIENPGILVPPLTPENIKQPHISYPYNPIMADVLFRTTFLESWGSGANRIVTACRKQNVPEPEWAINGGFVVVTFKRMRQGGNNNEFVSSQGTNGTQVGYKLDTTSDTSSDTSSERSQFLVNKLPLGYISLSDMMKACSMQSRPSFLVDYVTPAIEGGYIERRFPNSPNHPKQQYRLTNKGIALRSKVQNHEEDGHLEAYGKNSWCMVNK